MSATEHLYYQDPLLLTFDAQLVGHGNWKGAPSVILDRSAFYAEAGGQMADRGTLAGHAVIDVQIDEEGVVHHVLEGGVLPPLGQTVTGTVDRDRRRVHMALHTGQHMFSQALSEVAGADTISARLGETSCTVDVHRETVDERRVAEAEALVNRVIDDDWPVRAFFPSREELARLPLRSPPKVLDNIRVVAVGEFDYTPCGGTHCTHSAQVGVVRVLSVERNKGKARVVFNAGPRARSELLGEALVLRELARSFACPPSGVPGGVERLRRELSDVRETLGRAQGRVVELVGTGLAAEAASTGRVVAVFEDLGPELLRALANRITAVPQAVAFLAGRGPDGLSVLIARGSASTMDCGAWLKKMTAQAGGRGGGRPERAEGRLPATVDWPALVAALS